jgi:hypothetical protein
MPAGRTQNVGHLPIASIATAAFAVALVGTLVSCSGSDRGLGSNGSTQLGMQPSVSAPRASDPALATPSAAPAAVAVRAPITVDPWTWQTPSGPVEGKILSGKHYAVRTTKSDEALPSQLVRFSEAALDHYTSAITGLPQPSKRLETYLFATRDDWSTFTKERMGNDAGTYLALGRGGYTIDGEAVLYDLGRWDTLALAAHEGWHQYTQTVFRHSLPIWLEEGVATFMEGHRWQRGEEIPIFNPWRNYERFGELREAVRQGELIDLDEIMAGIPQGFLKSGRSKLLTYYAQVWALTHYLMEGEGGRYRPALEDLLRDAAEGRLASKVATSPNLPPGRGGRMLGTKVGRAVAVVYFNKDFAAFKKGYEDFIADITRRGSGDLVWRGQSPVSKPGESTTPAASKSGQ